MLAGLGHHPLVRSNNKHHQVHAPHPGNHGAHEFFVTRHIDDAEMNPSGNIETGKTEFNSDAA